MSIVAKAMIRNKPDSYCQAWDVMTTGISDFIGDLVPTKPRRRAD